MPDQLDDYLKVIGRITTDFSHLEARLAWSIGSFISDDSELNRRITVGRSCNDLLILFRSLFTYRITDVPLLESFAMLWNELNEINTERNRYIHSHWFLADADGGVFATRIKYSKPRQLGLKMEIANDELPKLSEFSVRIMEASDKLASLMKDGQSAIRDHRHATANKNYIKFDRDGAPYPVPATARESEKTVDRASEP